VSDQQARIELLFVAVGLKKRSLAMLMSLLRPRAGVVAIAGLLFAHASSTMAAVPSGSFVAVLQEHNTQSDSRRSVV
jgi:hypothetical protein